MHRDSIFEFGNTNGDLFEIYKTLPGLDRLDGGKMNLWLRSRTKCCSLRTIGRPWVGCDEEKSYQAEDGDIFRYLHH